jgi:hypothetical protein
LKKQFRQEPRFSPASLEQENEETQLNTECVPGECVPR